MKKESRLAFLAALLMVLFALPSALWGAGAKKQTITVLWFNDANESQVFQDTMSDYVKSHPNITLDLQVVPFSDYESKLKLMIAAGSAPDVARLSSNQVALFVDQLEPLTGKAFSELATHYFPSSLALGQDAAGRLVAMPTEATANGMIVNKTYFKNAGIDVDKLSKTWNWDQWVDAMKKVQKANPKAKYGIAVDFTPNRFSTFLFEAGGRFLTDDGKAMNFNTPATLDALNFFKKLHDDGLAPASIWMGSENPQEMFAAGLVACHVGGSWLLNAYSSSVKGFEWGAVRMQLHCAPMRNLNSRMFKALGPDAGYDSLNDSLRAAPLAAFLDELESERLLPKTIVYSLNPNDYEMMASVIGCFQDGSVPGKMQLGSAWWFNDNIAGIERQIGALASLGLLSRFVGMLTDSRSILSFPRHEYFRRILCRLVGGWMEAAEAPSDFEAMGGMIADISYRNALGYFGIPGIVG